jgi:DNA polymerase-3 subunit delta'
MPLRDHDEVVDRFRRILAQGRLASTFLFVGPDGIGKRTFALQLAQALLCTERDEKLLDPCGRCESCVQALAGTHPDILRISKPKEKSELPVALFIGSAEKRMQEGLCHDLALKPFFGRRRVAIIDDADYLNEEGANALLKTLEEPPPKSLLILIGTSLERQLPTIRSRCQIIRFAPLAAETIADLLVADGTTTDRAMAQKLAAWSDGSLAKARDLADPELWKFRQILLNRLADAELDSVRFAEAVGKFVDEAGTDAFRRRNRLRQLIGSPPSSIGNSSALPAARRHKPSGTPKPSKRSSKRCGTCQPTPNSPPIASNVASTPSATSTATPTRRPLSVPGLTTWCGATCHSPGRNAKKSLSACR